MKTRVGFAVLALGAAALVLGTHHLGNDSEAAQPPLLGAAGSRTDLADGVSALTGRPIESGALATRTDATALDAGTHTPAKTKLPAAASERQVFLSLRVVDMTGAAQAGVGLDWILRSGFGHAQSTPIDGVTDADGRLLVPKAPQWWPSLVARSGGPHAGMLRDVGVRSALPFDAYAHTDADDAPGTEWLDRDLPPGTVLDVVLPPSGAVRFKWGEITGADGVQLTELCLQVRRADGDHFQGWRAGRLWMSAGASEHLAPVGLGWEVSGELSARDVNGSLGHVRAPGPTAPGEVVTLHIEVDVAHQDLVELTGVAVAHEGTPLARSRRLHYEFGPDGAPRTAQGSLTLDEQGRWSVQVPRSWLESPLRLKQNGRQERRAAVPVDPARISNGVLDVGTITLRTVLPVDPQTVPNPTPLARGRVIDTEGAPVKGAEVSVWGRAHSLKDVVASPQNLALLASTYTRKDGSYDLAAVTELAPGVLRISARHNEFLSTTERECDQGATDIEFVLTRGARVSFVIQVEPILVLSKVIRPRLQGPIEDHEPVSMDSRNRSNGSSDEFPVCFTGVPAGEYTLVMDVGQSHLPLVELEVAVQGDTDLGSIDLRGRLGIAHFRLSNATGAPVDMQYFGLRDAATNEDVAHEAVRLDPGRVMLLAPLSGRDFTLDCREAGCAHVPRTLLRPIADVDAAVYTPLTVR